MASTHGLDLHSLKALQTAEQMEILDIVDSLRALGLSEITALPQLVVCGDQSSGKSSVLEAISGVPFPRQDNLCTRFATEVILRRASYDSISVSIVPGSKRSSEDRQRLLQFRHELTTSADFSQLFKDATNAMGLDATSSSFSKDILRVEICGSTQPQLTLVDLPGLIHSEISLKTSGDVGFVTELVETYIASPRSIILAVVSAKNDISNQIIINKARHVDPKGERTLGIITKPDTLPRNSGSEEAFINLARNGKVTLELGWHVVKNIDLGVEAIGQATRDAEEAQFFTESKFRELPPNSVRIGPLRTRLSKVLFQKIRAELPPLVKEIDSRITACKVEKEKIGPGRTSPEQQKRFLITVSENFQAICQDAIRGNYEHPFFHEGLEPERRLCANLMNKHFQFSHDLQNYGSLWNIVTVKDGNDRSRTRKNAIEEACVLLKRNRGQEV
jgi:GTPase SAR1 family protein